MNKKKAQKATCNRCNTEWKTVELKTCPKCQSKNIEFGEGRPKTEFGKIVETFRPGDWVRFKGLKYGEKEFPPFVGKLKHRHNCAQGCVEIDGHDLRLIFNPDGTLYCHAKFGILLDKYKKAPKTGK